jgi:hypothetical protein
MVSAVFNCRAKFGLVHQIKCDREVFQEAAASPRSDENGIGCLGVGWASPTGGQSPRYYTLPSALKRCVCETVAWASRPWCVRTHGRWHSIGTSMSGAFFCSNSISLHAYLIGRIPPVCGSTFTMGGTPMLEIGQPPIKLEGVLRPIFRSRASSIRGLVASPHVSFTPSQIIDLIQSVARRCTREAASGGTASTQPISAPRASTSSACTPHPATD